MNNSVGFAGFAATSLATRNVNAQATLLIVTDNGAGICAGKLGQGAVNGTTWAMGAGASSCMPL